MEDYIVRYVTDVCGVAVTPHYHALVQTPNGTTFAGRRGPYRSEEQAHKACQRHERYWRRALAAKGKTRLRVLAWKAKVGKGNTASFPLSIAPLWAIEMDEKKALRIERIIPSEVRGVQLPKKST